MRRKIVWVALVCLFLGALLGVLYVKTPQWIATYVEERMPGLKVGRVELGYPEVVFHDSHIERTWFKGTLRRMYADLDRNVRIEGGHVDIDFDKRPKTDGDPKPKAVQLKSIILDTFTIKRKMVTVEGDYLTSYGNVHCFNAASVRTTDSKVLAYLHIPMVSLTHGCLNDSKITIKSAMMGVHFPKDIPTFDHPKLVELTDIEIHTRDEFFKIKRLYFGGTPGMDASTVSVAYKQNILQVDADTLKVNHSWVSPDEKTFKDVKLTLDVAKKTGTLSSEAAVVSFDVDNRHVQGDQTCNEWVSALPEPPAGALQELYGAFSGRLSFEVSAEPTPRFNVKNSCKVDCSAEPLKELKQKFEYEVYDKNGKLFTRESGPGSKDWVPLHRFPVNIPSAFIRMEDPGFLGHKGILPASLKVALEQNLDRGRFYRGGSTITQQLAKNLWLKRHKTIGRKVEEAFLTIALESCLTKDQILELYFNVIEYGPNLYGIGPATQTYFDKPVERLTLQEAYFLAALLRNPKAALKPDQGGLAQARYLMASLAKNGMLAEELVPPSDDLDTSGWETQ